MKKLFLFLILTASTYSKVREPELTPTSFPADIKIQLVNILNDSNASSINEAITKFDQFLVSNPNYISRLTFLDIQDFIRQLRFRWDDCSESYASAAIMMQWAHPLSSDAKIKKIEQGLHQLFEAWRDQYQDFTNAVKEKNFEKIKHYIDLGMAFDEVWQEINFYKWSPECKDLLEKAGANASIINTIKRYYTLSYAIVMKDIVTIKQCLNEGLELNTHPWCVHPSRFPLIRAFFSKTGAEAIEFLISQNVDINQECTGEGSTALHLAAEFGDVNLIRLLISNGADINKQNKRGWTPLHYAVCHCQPKAVQALLDLEADLTITDKSNRTVLDWEYHFKKPTDKIENTFIPLLEKKLKEQLTR